MLEYKKWVRKQAEACLGMAKYFRKQSIKEGGKLGSWLRIKMREYAYLWRCWNGLAKGAAS